MTRPEETYYADCVTELCAAIDAHAAQAHAEGKQMVQHALDEIANKVGFWIRSEGQIRRYERAKKKESMK